MIILKYKIKKIKEFGESSGIDLVEYGKSKKQYICDRADLVVSLDRDNGLAILLKDFKDNPSNIGNILYFLKEEGVLNISDKEINNLKINSESSSINTGYSRGDNKQYKINVDYNNGVFQKIAKNIDLFLGNEGKEYLSYQKELGDIVKDYSFTNNFDNYQKLANMFVKDFGSDNYVEALDKMVMTVNNNEALPNDKGFIFNTSLKGKVVNVQVIVENHQIIGLDVPAMNFGFNRTEMLQDIQNRKIKILGV